MHAADPSKFIHVRLGRFHAQLVHEVCEQAGVIAFTSI